MGKLSTSCNQPIVMVAVNLLGCSDIRSNNKTMKRVPKNDMKKLRTNFCVMNNKLGNKLQYNNFKTKNIYEVAFSTNILTKTI